MENIEQEKGRMCFTVDEAFKLLKLEKEGGELPYEARLKIRDCEECRTAWNGVYFVDALWEIRSQTG